MVDFTVAMYRRVTVRGKHVLGDDSSGSTCWTLDYALLTMLDCHMLQTFLDLVEDIMAYILPEAPDDEEENDGAKRCKRSVLEAESAFAIRPNRCRLWIPV